MILEIIYKREKKFLSFVVKEISEINFLVNGDNIKIVCNGLECEIKTNKYFDSLVNAVCKTRNSIHNAFKNKNESLKIDLAKYL